MVKVAQPVAGERRTFPYCFHIFLLCFTEARPAVQLIFLLRFLSGAALAAQRHGFPFIRVMAGALVWECAVLFVYLFNGVADIGGDRVNQSGRPIARGLLHPSTARWVAIGAAVVSLGGGFALGPTMGLLVLALLVLGYLYSGPPWYLKSGAATSGLVACLGGLATYVAGRAAAGGPLLTSTLAFFAVTMSLWMGLVGSLTKDLSDIAGDAAAGRRTAALRYGAGATRRTASAVAVAVGAVFMAGALLARLAHPWPAMTLECGAIALAAVSLSGATATATSRRRWPYRAFMMTQYAVHLVFLATLLQRSYSPSAGGLMWRVWALLGALS